MYIEDREPEGLPIDRHPLIPRDRLTFSKDLFDVPIEPAWRGGPGGFLKGDLALQICNLTRVNAKMRKGVARSPRESSQNTLLWCSGGRQKATYIIGQQTGAVAGR